MARVWRCYVFEDILGDVQYVGESHRPYIRLIEHQIQPWILKEYWSHRTLLGTYGTEADALVAEDALIKKLRPRFNVKGNEGNEGRVSPYTMRYIGGPMHGQPYRPDLYPQPFRWTPPTDSQPWRPALASRGALTFGQGGKPRAGHGSRYRGTRAVTEGRHVRRVPSVVQVAAYLVAWFVLSVWLAYVWPAALTPALGPLGRLIAALTLVGLAAPAVARRRRLVGVVGVLVVGTLALLATKGM